MKKRIPILIFLICMILFSAVMAGDNYDTVKVIRVIDGDTIQVRFPGGRTEKIRLIGIDTPETVHPNKPVEYFGKQASNYTKRHLGGKQIKLSYDWNKRDRYGRLLAYIWVNGKLFNNQIIREGYAHAYLRYSFKDKYMKMFRESQRYARNHKLGLWGGESGKKPVIKKIPSGVKFVASKKSSVFHRLNCKWAKKIKPGNRIYYKTRRESDLVRFVNHNVEIFEGSCVKRSWSLKQNRRKSRARIRSHLRTGGRGKDNINEIASVNNS